MKRTILVVLTSVLILALGVGGIALISSSRADAQASSNQGARFAGPAKGGPGIDSLAQRGGPGDMPFPGDENDAYLAKALGISVGELQAAYQTAQQAAIDQALEKGLITQEQADQMKQNGKGFFGRGFKFSERTPEGAQIDFEALLANALGVSIDELQTAQQAAQEAAIQAAVQNGDLTQEQADLMQARQALQGTIDRDALTAQALGITLEELQAQRQTGKTMQDLLTEQNLTQAEFQAAYQTAYQAAVEQAVADGVITQAQADLILNQDKGFGPGWDFHGLERGPKPGWNGSGGAHDLPAQPGSTEGTQL
jgi:hypothetical protein